LHAINPAALDAENIISRLHCTLLKQNARRIAPGIFT
jgi:hypothetical protein